MKRFKGFVILDSKVTTIWSFLKDFVINDLETTLSDGKKLLELLGWLLNIELKNNRLNKIKLI